MPKKKYKKYIVELSSDEREYLNQLAFKGKVLARRRQHAQILLKADESAGSPAWSDSQIAEAFEVSVRTVERVRRRCVEFGLEDALTHRQNPHGPKKRKKLDGVAEAHLCKIACSAPPDGRERWTMQLLADRPAQLEVVSSIRDETVRTTLKKNEIKPWLKKEWCIPPEKDAEFVCVMEQVLDLYQQPYDPEQPVVCMDESTKQLTREVIAPLTPQPGRVEPCDSLYKRNGVAVIFMFFEPLSGFRRVNLAQGKTRIDWADQIKELLDVHYPKAKKVHLVLDNLNTHKGASLYEAFPAEEAHRLLSRLEFHYTPKHGSWLNTAEIELSILSRQRLSRRIGEMESLKRQTTAWQNERNQNKAKANWQFKTEDARIKLTKLYPTI